MKKRIDKNIFIIIFISICIRIVYISYQPNIKLTPDSYEYYEFANNIASKPTVKLLFQPYRAPIYPFIILGTMIATGSIGAPIGSEAFERSTELLMILQSITAILGSIVLYTFLRVPFLYTAIYSMNLLLIPWERTMLTESFAVFWMIIYAYVIVRIIKKFSLNHLFLLLLLSMFGLYLRPALIFLPITAFVLLFFFLPRIAKVKTAIALIMYGAVILLHSQLNFKNWNYRGFQIIGEFNLLGRILQFNLPVDAGRQYEFFYTNILDYRKRNGEPNPYRFIDTYDPALSVNPKKLAELTQFNRTIILNNLPSYIWRSFIEIPKAFTTISPFIRIQSTYLSVIQKFYSFLHALLLLVFVASPFILTRSKNRSIVIIWIISFVHVFASTLLGYEDLSRLIAPVIPLLFVLSPRGL